MEGPPDHIAMLANGTYIHEYQRTIANKEVVFKWVKYTPSNGYTPGLSAERADKNTYLPASSWKGLNYKLSQMLPAFKLLIYMYLGAD